ncbi:MAG: DUF6782 family putative metallopeptidase [Alphaproteobacteria bacterium]
MSLSLSYLKMSDAEKCKVLLSYALQDKLFEKIIDDLSDYGYEVSFSFFGGAGAYMPFAVATESLDNPSKQAQFSSGFWRMIESGQYKARFRLSLFAGLHGAAHSFLHEMMHFYQDMYGLYALPLQEQGRFPICLNANSDIVAILFCEAFAQVEAIRTSWALLQTGDDLGWRGALSSPDWAGLAKQYDDALQSGVDEAKAAADIFKAWYKGKHRTFYEQHALSVHETNMRRYCDGVQNLSDAIIGQNLRSIEIPALFARLPQENVPRYFGQIDWNDPLFMSVQSPKVQRQLELLETRFGNADNPNIQDIKCGAPPYLWHRLRMSAQNDPDHPPMEMSGGMTVGSEG